ncbi:MAG: PKD domain-containing protein, partial [Bacteroidia bacterium]
PLPTASFSAGKESDGDAVAFTNASTPAAGVTYSWTFGDGGLSSLSDPTHLYGSEGDFVTWLYVTLGNCTDSTSTTVTVYPRPDASFFANPTVSNFMEPEIQFEDNSLGATVWNWAFDDGTFSSEENPSHFYVDTGIHPVILIVSNDFGCSDTTDSSIRIDPYMTFYAPNAFTPDGDGINDEFLGYGEDVFGCEMRIFSRWGPQIFNSYDKNVGWDGTNQLTGGAVPPGVYVYSFRITDVYGRSYDLRGRVTLVR